ncbi:MAG: hypothetical protein JXA37_04195 [Chloroflexia bacterium]|nr:hypothetical protein [Chloroflexia bacterium]
MQVTLGAILETIDDHRESLEQALGAEAWQDFCGDLGRAQARSLEEGNEQAATRSVMAACRKNQEVWRILEREGLVAPDPGPEKEEARKMGEEKKPLRTKESEKPAERQERWQGTLMIMKESLTGCIGLLIVGTTLLLVLVSSLLVLTRPEGDIGPLKEILLFMNGLIGVVLGYYFGRVPAEMRAQKAEAAEAEAQGKAEESRDRLAEVRGGLEGLKADVAQRRQAHVVRGEKEVASPLSELEERLEQLLERTRR